MHCNKILNYKEEKKKEKKNQRKCVFSFKKSISNADKQLKLEDKNARFLCIHGVCFLFINV